jgi:hypothetical protein
MAPFAGLACIGRATLPTGAILSSRPRMANGSGTEIAFGASSLRKQFAGLGRPRTVPAVPWLQRS